MLVVMEEEMLMNGDGGDVMVETLMVMEGEIVL